MTTKYFRHPSSQPKKITVPDVPALRYGPFDMRFARLRGLLRTDEISNSVRDVQPLPFDSASLRSGQALRSLRGSVRSNRSSGSNRSKRLRQF